MLDRVRGVNELERARTVFWLEFEQLTAEGRGGERKEVAFLLQYFSINTLDGANLIQNASQFLHTHCIRTSLTTCLKNSIKVSGQTYSRSDVLHVRTDYFLTYHLYYYLFHIKSCHMRMRAPASISLKTHVLFFKSMLR